MTICKYFHLKASYDSYIDIDVTEVFFSFFPESEFFTNEDFFKN